MSETEQEPTAEPGGPVEPDEEEGNGSEGETLADPAADDTPEEEEG